jgi:hypothetical protein
MHSPVKAEGRAGISKTTVPTPPPIVGVPKLHVSPINKQSKPPHSRQIAPTQTAPQPKGSVVLPTPSGLTSAELR